MAAEVERGRERDAGAAFLRVYDDHANDIYAFFSYRGLDRSDAEDMTQGVFERALLSWHRYDPARTKPNTWLIAIARNLLIDRHRRSKVRNELLFADTALIEANSEPFPPPEETLAGLDPELERALEDLSDREREIIALRFGGDLQGAEVAEVTGLSLANVQQILSRSLRRLRGKLEGG